MQAGSTEWLLNKLRDEDFSFSMKGWRGRAEDFFGRRERTGELLESRRRVLAQARDRHLGVTAGAEEAVRAALTVVAPWNPGLDPRAADPAEALTTHLEPDWVVLNPAGPSPAAGFVYAAGGVCFPSNWRPEEKLGRPMLAVHAPVPGLNRAIGSQVDGLLARLADGLCWQRINLGWTGSDRLNQHPDASDWRRGAAARAVAEVWLRVEEQAFLRLPGSAAVLFGIRVLHYPLSDLRADPRLQPILLRQLKSLPEEMRAYKGLGEGAAERLLAWLAVSADPDVTS